MKINVIVKRPGEKPVHTNISNTLENLQKTVGGYIETVTLFTDCVIICNEEGLIQGLPYCATICGVDFVGPIVIAGVDGDELCDLPLSWKDIRKLFPQLWEAVS